MKTFKMLSFNIIQNNESVKHLPIIEGIIINQENEEKTWLLEIFLEDTYKEMFEQKKASEEEFDIETVISFPENEPAPFTVKIIDILQLDNQISVLMKGKIKYLRQHYAKQLLKKLLAEDLSKEELIQKFEQGLKKRPRLK